MIAQLEGGELGAAPFPQARAAEFLVPEPASQVELACLIGGLMRGVRDALHASAGLLLPPESATVRTTRESTGVRISPGRDVNFEVRLGRASSSQCTGIGRGRRAFGFQYSRIQCEWE